MILVAFTYSLQDIDRHNERMTVSISLRRALNRHAPTVFKLQKKPHDRRNRDHVSIVERIQARKPKGTFERDSRTRPCTFFFLGGRGIGFKCVVGVCSCMRGALLCFSAHLYDGADLELSEHPVSEEVVHLPTVRQGTMQQSIPETPRCRQTRRTTGGVQMRHLRAGILLA